MSTFNGFIKEIPDITVDYFRSSPGRPAPLAGFLSHVHSDHLLGLDSFKSPFIYCSPATRELLLRLEKFSNRINFAQGILEQRKQSYTHLKRLLKTIPLNTPTDVEISLNRSIRVTLLDANHCVGAVMFLFQSGALSILYTGDIRSEHWWVESIRRNPVMIPYTHGLKTLDMIYMDTTYATKTNSHQEFISKSDSIGLLLQKVLKYPRDTIFHFSAWTFGYEEVFVALSAALCSQMHVTAYSMRLYKALTTLREGTNSCIEGPALAGFPCGNHNQPGCLTDDDSVRLHACEKAGRCRALQESNTVYIIPVVNHTKDGTLVGEAGTGKLVNTICPTQEFEALEGRDVSEFLKVLKKSLKDERDFLHAIENFSLLEGDISGLLTPQTCAKLGTSGAFPLSSLSHLLAQCNTVGGSDASAVAHSVSAKPDKVQTKLDSSLPRVIHLPYPRHSSYKELLMLLKIFSPKDVYPCVTNPDLLSYESPIQYLFGEYMSSSGSRFDLELREERRRQGEQDQSLESTTRQVHYTKSTSPVAGLPGTNREMSNSHFSSGQLTGSTAEIDSPSTISPNSKSANIRASLFNFLHDAGINESSREKQLRPASSTGTEKSIGQVQDESEPQGDDGDSQITLPHSAFESQSTVNLNDETAGCQMTSSLDSSVGQGPAIISTANNLDSQLPSILRSESSLSTRSGRANHRKEAYAMARRFLDFENGGDSSSPTSFPNEDGDCDHQAKRARKARLSGQKDETGTALYTPRFSSGSLRKDESDLEL